MKPTVPERGTVIRLEGDSAEIMLEGGKSCKGCGAAKIGLCRAGGGSMFLKAQNTAGAAQGDQVIIGIDAKTRRIGYLLAYIIPLASFVAGALLGNILGGRLSLPSLDVLTAFVLLVLASTWSLRRLKKLDRDHSLEVKRIVSDNEFIETVQPEEERLYLKYTGHC